MGAQHAPRHIFRLPHEWRSRVTNTVCDEHDRVRRDALRVPRGDARDPRQRQDEARGADASEPLPEEQPDLVLPGQKIDQENAEEIRDEVDRPDIGATVRIPCGELHPCINGDDLNSAVDAAKERGLEVRKAERGDDNLPLVRQAVWDVVEGGEERE